MSMFHVEVIARDRGTPPQSSTGLVQVMVEGGQDVDTLKFENASYTVEVAENSPKGSQVLRVTATAPGGSSKNGPITYSFGSGHEDDLFMIDPSTGIISVKNSERIDFERITEVNLIVVAKAIEQGQPIYAYANVNIKIIDLNDNSPRFTQDQYVSSVWEGNNKGTYVIQVSATDDDLGRNGDMMYYIVDGNHDDAFIIDPPFSGVVKTNIVLDREIREMYRLTIIATDDGSPEMSGTCTLRINIVDVNDNQPTFPPHSLVQVSEGKFLRTTDSVVLLTYILLNFIIVPVRTM